MEEFLQEISLIKWFEHCKDSENKYHVIHSIFEAYDVWNEQMLKIWKTRTLMLENMAVEQLGDEQIDRIFELVSSEIGDVIWQKWCEFINEWHLEEEVGLDNEMLDMVKRDVSWACIEKIMNVQDFFTKLLDIYKEGYFPCAWEGDYPNGRAVVL